MENRTYEVGAADVLWLGRQGETGTRSVSVDCSPWLTEMPGCELMIAAKRNGETALYLPSVTAADGVVTWEILAQDTQKAGYGQAEVRASLNGKIRKSKIFRTQVEKALDGPEGPAGTLPDWVEEVRGAVSEAQAAAAEAEQAALDALEVNAEAAVRHDKSQALGADAQARARANIGVSEGAGKDNTIFSVGSVSVSGTDVPLTAELYAWAGPFADGQKVKLTASAVSGAESAESCLCLILTDAQDTVIRRVFGGISGTAATVGTADLSAGLAKISCAFCPAQTAQLAGTAVLTGLRMTLGDGPVFMPSAAFAAWAEANLGTASANEVFDELGI